MIQTLINESYFKFKLKDALSHAQSDNEMTKKLSEEILKDGRLFMSPCQVADMFLLRMVICSSLSQQSNVDYAWKVIRELTDKLMRGKGQSSKAQ